MPIGRVRSFSRTVLADVALTGAAGLLGAFSAVGPFRGLPAILLNGAGVDGHRTV
jgi:hypothetical protein